MTMTTVLVLLLINRKVNLKTKQQCNNTYLSANASRRMPF